MNDPDPDPRPALSEDEDPAVKELLLAEIDRLAEEQTAMKITGGWR